METLDREEAAYLRLSGGVSGGGNASEQFYHLAGDKSDCTLPSKPDGAGGGARTRFSRMDEHSNNHLGSNTADESQSVATDVRGWDIFRLLPPKNDNLAKGMLNFGIFRSDSNTIFFGIFKNVLLSLFGPTTKTCILLKIKFFRFLAWHEFTGP